jgi:hypothetical protein
MDAIQRAESWSDKPLVDSGCGTNVGFHLVPYFEECSPGVVNLNYEFIFQILY